MDLLSGINLAVILGSASTHLTTEYAPVEGYNQNHKSIGIELVQSKEGLTHGAQLFKFKDSFNKASHTALYSLGYTKSYKQASIRPSLAMGYIKTSYYNGLAVLPAVSFNLWRVGVDVSYLPKIQGADAVLMFQSKFKLN